MRTPGVIDEVREDREMAALRRQSCAAEGVGHVQLRDRHGNGAHRLQRTAGPRKHFRPNIGTVNHEPGWMHATMRLGEPGGRGAVADPRLQPMQRLRAAEEDSLPAQLGCQFLQVETDHVFLFVGVWSQKPAGAQEAFVIVESAELVGVH